jgi:hypothetical protein
MKIMNNNEKLAKIAVNKSLLKEYSNSSNERVVYMDDNTEFQIQIFNPYSYIIGVSFEFNKTSKNNQLLVLRPGERVWIERYLDNDSRLLFSTYKVNSSAEVKNAIKNNGGIRIKFYKERETESWLGYTPISTWFGSAPIDDTMLQITSCTNSINSVQSNSITNFNSNINAASSNTVTTGVCPVIDNKSIETGRVERGSHSNQKLTHIQKDFELFPFKMEDIKILPSSQKQINSNDLHKRYCHNCGHKLNQKYKFCPYCGAEQ